jgi:hypothetical protein
MVFDEAGQRSFAPTPGTYPASVDPTKKKEHNKYNEHDADKAYTPVPITIAVTPVTTADPSQEDNDQNNQQN